MSKKEKFWRFPRYLEAAGPGVITGAADDDPSGIGTYTMAGARHGLAFLWTAFFTWPLMAGVQLACARVGMVTGEGLATAFGKVLPRPLVVLAVLALFFANTLNIAADLSAMGDAARLLVGVPSFLAILLFAMGITWATVFLRYSQIAMVLKWLALALFVYVFAAFEQKPNWSEVARAAFSFQAPSMGVLVAILGTTISPYLFFWQASQEVEEEKSKGRHTLEARIGASANDIRIRRIDVSVGTFFSNFVMFFIILTAALTLNAHGFKNVETSSEAAKALEPIAGKFAALLYTLGLVGTGLLAIPTLTGSSAYAFAETFRWKQGLDEKWNRARAFYSVIVGSTIIAVSSDYFGFNPLKALYWSAIANGILSPFLLVALYIVVSNKKIMKGQESPLPTRITVAITALLMFLAVGALLM